MVRSAAVFLALSLAVSAAVPTTASAAQRSRQYQGTPAERAACRPDAQRFCRSARGEQTATLNCLQDHRSRLSRACRGVLERNGL